jgi:hypothetical protein
MLNRIVSSRLLTLNHLIFGQHIKEAMLKLQI